ncbi:exosporium leader peptide [Bacillus thuringiensis]|nr:exosporium leader peptide [Bacillus thuringiensis]MRB61371.1 exosporium leader peptide [Bacillus thuringiensis]
MSNSDKDLRTTSVDANVIGPTFASIPPVKLPTGPTGDTGPPGVTGPTGLPILAYGYFWQTEILTVSFQDFFSFNHLGPTAGGVSLANPTAISISQSGDYRISFIATINISGLFPQIPIISLTLNNSPILNSQSDFGIQVNNSASTGCYELCGELILAIPSNSTLQLRNNSFIDSENITTCGASGLNTLELTIFKLSL